MGPPLPRPHCGNVAIWTDALDRPTPKRTGLLVRLPMDPDGSLAILYDLVSACMILNDPL